MATPQITVTANLQTITGSNDAAWVVYELVNFSGTVPRISGTCVLVQTSFKAVADGSGNTSVQLYGEDVITPAGTYYVATFYNESGGPVASVPYQFTGSGTFDLSQVVPMGQVVVAPQQPNAAVPQILSPMSHQFLTGMNALGVFSTAQVNYSDLAGTLPLPGPASLGGVKSLAPTAGVFLTGIGTDGTPTTGTASFSVPTPTAISLGGAFSSTAPSHQFVTGLNTSGALTTAQPAFTDISGTASTGQIPSLAASIITSGLLALARGGTNADLSATGGTSQVLKQITAGAAITVGQLAASDLSNGTTGSGSVVLAGSPTLTTPTLGVATATSINKVTITAPATSATLTIANGKTLTTNNSLTLAGTDGTTMTFPSSSDTVVTLGASQTLSSKTLSSPVISGTITSYNGTSTTGIGVPVMYGTNVDLVSQTANQSANVVSSAVAGSYMLAIGGSYSVTTAAATGSFVVTFNGIQITNQSITAGGGGSGTFNIPATSGIQVVALSSGGSIPYTVTTTGTGNVVTYTLHIRAIYLG